MKINPYTEQIRQMKEEFDQSFARPISTDSSDYVDLLAIHAVDAFALRVGEVLSVAVCKRILPLPGAADALIGLAGIRGNLIPVWSLAALLGYESPPREARCLALMQTEALSWAVAFESMDGYFRIPSSEVKRATVDGMTARFATDLCPLSGMVRPVLSIPLLFKSVKQICESSQARRQEK